MSRAALAFSGKPGYARPVKLLLEEQERTAQREERERLSVRTRLREALREFIPGQGCWLYGSITKPDQFRRWSDVDLALESLPTGRSIYLLASLLCERTGRPVDLVILEETRLREKIVREGERWIIP